MTVLQRQNKPTHTQIAIVRRFCPNLCVISLPIEIFRRLNAIFTALCVQNGVHAFSSVETSPDTSKSKSFVVLSKFMRYSSPDRDISSLKRSFHCIMRADRSACALQRRNEPRHTKIAIIHRFWRQLCVISLPFEIFRRLNALFTALCVPNVVHAFSSAETSSDTSKSQSFVDFLQIYA